MSEPMSDLMSGTAAHPAEACQAYHAAGRDLVESLGEPVVDAKGSECLMPEDALGYYFAYTAQIGPASLGRWDYTGALRSLSAPLLVIYGNRDAAELEVQREWLEAVDSARLLAVPGAGKAVHVERPRAVFDAIDAFLGGDWPPSSEPRGED